MNINKDTTVKCSVCRGNLMLAYAVFPPDGSLEEMIAGAHHSSHGRGLGWAEIERKLEIRRLGPAAIPVRRHEVKRTATVGVGGGLGQFDKNRALRIAIREEEKRNADAKAKAELEAVAAAVAKKEAEVKAKAQAEAKIVADYETEFARLLAEEQIETERRSALAKIGLTPERVALRKEARRLRDEEIEAEIEGQRLALERRNTKFAQIAA